MLCLHNDSNSIYHDRVYILIKKGEIFIKKKLLINLFILIVLVLCIGCKKKESEDLTTITITNGDQTINYNCIHIEKNTEEDTNKITDTFRTLADKESKPVLIKENEDINIEFGVDPPKKVTLYDHYIDPSDGSDKYADADIIELKPNEDDINTYSYTLGHTSAEMFESNLSGYQYRGLCLRCEWDDKTDEYLFVVKTQRISNTQSHFTPQFYLQ